MKTIEKIMYGMKFRKDKRKKSCDKMKSEKRENGEKNCVLSILFKIFNIF